MDTNSRNYTPCSKQVVPVLRKTWIRKQDWDPLWPTLDKDILPLFKPSWWKIQVSPVVLQRQQHRGLICGYDSKSVGVVHMIGRTNQLWNHHPGHFYPLVGFGVWKRDRIASCFAGWKSGHSMAQLRIGPIRCPFKNNFIRISGIKRLWPTTKWLGHSWHWQGIGFCWMGAPTSPKCLTKRSSLA